MDKCKSTQKCISDFQYIKRERERKRVGEMSGRTPLNIFTSEEDLEKEPKHKGVNWLCCCYTMSFER